MASPARFAFVVLGSVSVAAFFLGASEAGASSAVPPCVEVSSEARYRGYGYDHIVRIANGCERAATCDVSTDVNPTPERTTIPSKEQVEILTFRGSPAREFVPRVECKL